MRPEWEAGLRGRVYAFGRRIVPLSWRRAVRRRMAPERLLGIRKPPIDVPRYDFDPNEARPGCPDILFLPVISWAYRRQRPQQLAEALGRRRKRIFYGTVERTGEPREPTGVAPGVTLLPIDGVTREDPGDRRLEGRALQLALDSITRTREEFELYEAAVVVESPFWVPLALRLRDAFRWRIVYDCLDEHTGFATNRPHLLADTEEELVSQADLVVATSEVLRERLSERKPSVRLLPNACDYELFAAVPDPAPRPGRLRVGYVGAVDDWFDAELFGRLARLRPDWDFDIVGEREGRGQAWPELPNVTFHGEQPHGRLPELRGRFDVEIIPFRLSPLTDAVDPVKFYEAAAAGRTMVATPMRSLLPLANRGLMRLAATASDFASEIEAACAEAPGQSDRLRAFARQNTWDHRAAQLDAWIHELYPLISIVVATHNGLAWTQRCLQSLERRTDWPRWEAVLVDNGSTDGTRPWLLEQVSQRGPGWRVLTFSENRGFAPAVNAGVAASRGEYLCILNNDTVVTRGWLSGLVAALERDPSLGMVSPSTNEVANAAKVAVGYRDLNDLDPWARQFVRGNRGRSDPIDMLAMFCVLLRRETWDDAGPLDERFSVGMFEDDDYSRRLRARGFRLAVVRDAFVHHHGRGTFATLPEAEYLRIYRENRRRFREKWGLDAPVGETPRSARERLRSLAESQGAVFVFPPSIGWNVTLVQRPHHLARAFARRGVPVVFQNGEQAGAATGLAEVEPALFLHEGDGALPPLTGRIVWAFAYNVPKEEDLDGARLVYDVIDHPAVFPGPGRKIRRNHERALRRAEAVFVASRPLLEEIRRSRPDAVYLPNGCEVARFAAAPVAAAIPARLARARAAGRPVAGYVGALARWVDGDLLEELARMRSDWDFFLVGEPLDSSFDRLLGHSPPNLIFAGPRPYEAIPSILSAFDAGLIPFRLGAEGRHASPIKLYEYLAAGLPVLSTPVPECLALREVRIGTSARAFAGLLDEARESGRSEDYRARAHAIARASDWERRAGAVLDLLRVRAEPPAERPARPRSA